MQIEINGLITWETVETASKFLVFMKGSHEYQLLAISLINICFTCNYLFLKWVESPKNHGNKSAAQSHTYVTLQYCMKINE